MSQLDIFAGQVLNFLSLFQQPVPGRFIPKTISLCWSLCTAELEMLTTDQSPPLSGSLSTRDFSSSWSSPHTVKRCRADIFRRISKSELGVFPRCSVLNYAMWLQFSSNVLPPYVAHLCFSPVCVFWSFTTSVANHYLLCSFRVRSLEDLSPEHWELGGVLGVAVVTAWQGVGRLERADEVKRTTTSLPGKNLSFIWSGILSPANCHNSDLARWHDLEEGM